MSRQALVHAPTERTPARTPLRTDQSMRTAGGRLEALAAMMNTSAHVAQLASMQENAPSGRTTVARQREFASHALDTGELGMETPGVVQAKWVDASEPFLRWEPAEGGYAWWFNTADRTMTYTEDSVQEMTPELAEALPWKSHKTWQKEHLSRIDPDKQTTPPFNYESLVAKGQERWQRLQKSGPGSLHPVTQGARDWFFNEYYTRVPSLNEDTFESRYNAIPDSYRQKRQIGQYRTRITTSEGNMTPDQTYALGGPGEVYYNPRSGEAERMPPSEILFQQWRTAGKEQGVQNPVLRVKEETVAGDALPMLKVIRTGSKIEPGQDAVFRPGDAGFFAMLAIPNVTAALFLIQDHGKELGIGTITAIELLKNSHIRVYFG